MSLNELKSRAQAGDAGAAARLRQKLSAQMPHIVRRALVAGPGRSPVNDKIRAVARRVADPGSGRRPGRGEPLVRRVARRVCASLVTVLRRGLSPSQRLKETVRN
jgi:hypothetical protein